MTTTGNSATSRRARARRGEGDRLRDDIMAAAERLLIETGDADAVSIRAVAETVGVTPPSIYLHFADKADLIFQVCQQQWDAFDEHLRAAVEDIEDPIQWLSTIGSAYVRWGLDNPEQYRVVFMSRPREVPPDVDKQALLTAGVFGDLLSVLQRAVERGQLTGDPQVIGFCIWSSAHGLTSLLISMPDMPWPDLDRLIPATLNRALERPGTL
jgi:AcrR family transcriptional regulator